jgi:hypothetical protein
MAEISETLNIGGEVVNIEITETAQAVPENPEPAPVAVSSPAPQEERKREEPQKVTTKLSTPNPQPNPGSKPGTDAAANGKTAGVLSMPDWVAADRAWKESQPLPISDGRKGVSN